MLVPLFDAGDDRQVGKVIPSLNTGSDYVNQIGLETERGSDRIKTAFGVNYDRLAALTKKSHLTNLFRHNQKIRPTM